MGTLWIGGSILERDSGRGGGLNRRGTHCQCWHGISEPHSRLALSQKAGGGQELRGIGLFSCCSGLPHCWCRAQEVEPMGADIERGCGGEGGGSQYE